MCTAVQVAVTYSCIDFVVRALLHADRHDLQQPPVLLVGKFDMFCRGQDGGCYTVQFDYTPLSPQF